MSIQMWIAMQTQRKKPKRMIGCFSLSININWEANLRQNRKLLILLVN